MSPSAEFRKAIEQLLSEVQRLLRADCVRLYPFEYDDEWENEVTTLIWDRVVRSGLLEKIPARLSQLQPIKEQICGLYLIRIIQLEPPPCNPFDPKFDHATIARDLQVLEFKLCEMLEVIDADTSDGVQPAGPSQEEQRRRNTSSSPQYSAEDEKLLEHIASSDVEKLSVAALWKQYRRTWNDFWPKRTQAAFRATIYRIKNHRKWLSRNRSKKVVQ